MGKFRKYKKREKSEGQKLREEQERLAQFYASMDLQALSDAALQEQVLTIGWQCQDYILSPLREQFVERIVERWRRLCKAAEGMGCELQEQLRRVDQQLRTTVANVYADTLSTARATARELSRTGSSERETMIVSLYVESFAPGTNIGADDAHHVPGLLDMLMPYIPMSLEFCRFGFVAMADKEVAGPTLEELFAPRPEDRVWEQQLPNIAGVAELSRPLRWLFGEQHVALQDIAAINRFGFEVEYVTMGD